MTTETFRRADHRPVPTSAHEAEASAVALRAPSEASASCCFPLDITHSPSRRRLSKEIVGRGSGNCGGRLGDYGEKLLNCSLPVDQLPLNARAEAWLTFADHVMSPMLAECAIPTVPNIFGGPFYIWAFPDHLTFQHNEGAVGLITRHMDGRTRASGGPIVVSERAFDRLVGRKRPDGRNH